MVLERTGKKMKPFRSIYDKAIPLDMINVDTDQIIPKQFLRMVKKEGYGDIKIMENLLLISF